MVFEVAMDTLQRAPMEPPVLVAYAVAVAIAIAVARSGG